MTDLPLTREMVAAMRKAVPAVERTGTLPNTHRNPDHTFGNQPVGGAAIVSSDACLEEMGEFGDEFVQTPPTRISSGERTIHVGAKEVRFIEVIGAAGRYFFDEREGRLR